MTDAELDELGQKMVALDFMRVEVFATIAEVRRLRKDNADAFRRGAESMREAAAKAVDGRRKSLAEATDSARWEWVREGSDTWLELGKAARTVESLPLEPPHKFGPLIDGAPKKLTQEDIDRVLGKPNGRLDAVHAMWKSGRRELIRFTDDDWARTEGRAVDTATVETEADLIRERDWLRGGT